MDWAGSLEVYSADEGKTRAFIATLERYLDDEDGAVREVRMGEALSMKFVWFEGDDVGDPHILGQDRFGRITVPVHVARGRALDSLSVGEYGKWVEVVRVDEVFVDDRVDSYTLYLAGGATP